MKSYFRFRRLIPALFLSVMLLGLTVQSPAQNEPAEWNLMFYMDLDNNLEAAQMQDLDEMMAVGSSSNVNIVILCDRSAKGDDEDGYTSRPSGYAASGKITHFYSMCNQKV